MSKKNDYWTLFSAGISAPFISYAISIVLSAFYEILIATGAIGAFVALLLAISEEYDSIMELFGHLSLKEVSFFIGFAISIAILSQCKLA